MPDLNRIGNECLTCLLVEMLHDVSDGLCLLVEELASLRVLLVVFIDLRPDSIGSPRAGAEQIP